jgi:hypothetical protein
MLLKYTVDASVVWAFAGRWWSPLGYLNPVWTVRQQLLRDAPDWLAPALVAWTLPFLWIGVSMTLRRAVDAGRSPWWCLLFFVPLINYATMLWLAAQPPPMREWSPYREVNPPHLDGYFRATHGEFRLIPLPGGRTRLEGRTRYQVSLFPQVYWTLPAGRLVTAIHERVLRHIKASAEEEDHP